MIRLGFELRRCALQTYAGCCNLAAHREAVIRNKTIIALQVIALGCVLATPGMAAAAELKPEAVQGFDLYVRLTEQRMQKEIQPGAAFLWVDGLPEARRNDARAQLLRGEVVSARLE